MGKRSAQTLTAEQRTERARIGARSRWEKQKGEVGLGPMADKVNQKREAKEQVTRRNDR